jgi:Holliday junction resolvase
MTSASKAKGSSFEREVVTYLREHGFPYAERGVAGATDDIGDIIGTPGVVWECKNQKRMDLAGWVDELNVEIANQLARYGQSSLAGAVIHKRRGTTDPGNYYATLPLSLFVKLLKETDY